MILATANPRSTVFYRAFEQRLRELGYVEGQNIVFEYPDAQGKLDRLPGRAAELVRLNVDVLIVASDRATLAVKKATSSIPIVMVGVNYDPVALGYVTSLSRPGGNITGVVFQPAEGLLGMVNWLYKWYDPRDRLSVREIAAQFSTVALAGLVGAERSGERAIKAAVRKRKAT